MKKYAFTPVILALILYLSLCIVVSCSQKVSKHSTPKHSSYFMLKQALENKIWQNHKIGDVYTMDGIPGWKIAYYPIFEDGKTGDIYEAPRALVEKPAQWKRNNILVDGIDFREVPIDFLSKVI